MEISHLSNLLFVSEDIQWLTNLENLILSNNLLRVSKSTKHIVSETLDALQQKSVPNELRHWNF